MVIYQLKIRVEGLYPTLEYFNKTVTIRLLMFLATLTNVFDTVGASKSPEVL